MSETENWLRVAAVKDVAEGSVLGVEAKGRHFAVCHLAGGEICVTDNVCTHAFALLSDGWLEDGVLECPLHAGQFDVRTGKGLGAPIDEDLRVYAIRVENGEIFVDAGE